MQRKSKELASAFVELPVSFRSNGIFKSDNDSIEPFEFVALMGALDESFGRPAIRTTCKGNRSRSES